MFEVNVTIKCPDLILAANAIAAAFKPSTQATVAAPAQTQATPTPVVPTAAPAAPVTAPVATQTPVYTVQPAAPAPAPAPTAPTTAPTSPAPSFTHDQVGKAGADLIAANPVKMPELVALLKQYGVSAITQLAPDQLGSFATALRGLGAKI